MIYGIPLTHDQYWTAAFIFVQFGLFYTAKQVFAYPDEVENDSNSCY
jgi:hypothetical protein